MSLSEIEALIKARNDHEKQVWEQVRKICFYSAQTGETEASFQKYFPLPWDKRPKKEAKKLTKEQLEKKTKLAEKWLERTKQV